jgi:hypothetical protein
MQSGGDCADVARHLDSGLRVVGERLQHRRPRVAGRRQERLEHRGDRGPSLVGLVREVPGQRRRLREPDVREKRAHLQVRVEARLEPAVRLEDHAAAEDDRGVRLLAANDALCERLGAAAGVGEELGERRRARPGEPPARRRDVGLVGHRGRDRRPRTLAFTRLAPIDARHEIVIRLPAGGVRDLEDGQLAARHRPAVRDRHVGDRSSLGAKPATPDDPFGREAARCVSHRAV